MAKTKWVNKAPDYAGWFWIKYRGKHGISKCPCEVTYFKGGALHGEWIARTARNDSFYSHTGLSKDVKFGPPIPVPP
jgi:hypothetical protein